MSTRRSFLCNGLAAIGASLIARRGFAWIASPPTPPCPASGGLNERYTDPFRPLPDMPASVVVDGLPFMEGFTADGFADEAIPFHSVPDLGKLPEPQESVNVAVIGGGISGLATAYLLREQRPVLFELRERFGGNALGETWRGTRFSLGSAYVIVPDAGSFLESFYRELGVHRAARVSFPPDPIEIGGAIRDDFWDCADCPPEERLAFERYAEVVTYMAEKGYPEIPLPDDPKGAAWVRELDRRTFREDVEERMGMPMPPLLAAAVQAYFYSSFGAGFDEISAAGGWNFVAAEEYGRWVFPGGNGWLARAMWERLARLDNPLPIACRPHHLRAGCRVVDVRLSGPGVQVAWLDSAGELRTLAARHVVMAGSKHVAKHVLHELESLDPEKAAAMDQIETAAYVVANVLLDARIERDFYDCFLIHDECFPMTPGDFEQRSQVVDMLSGHYAAGRGRSVLTLYWPLPYPSGRFSLLDDAWNHYSASLAPQVRSMLALLDVPESAVRQVRMSRWGHAMPVARPHLIADGVCETAARAIAGRIHFVNQDNWALPAVENSLLDAQRTAERIQAAL